MQISMEEADKLRACLAMALMALKNERREAQIDYLANCLAKMANMRQPMDETAYKRGMAILEGIKLSHGKPKKGNVAA